MKVLILIEPLAEVLDPEVSHEVDLAIEQSQRPRFPGTRGAGRSREGGGG